MDDDRAAPELDLAVGLGVEVGPAAQLARAQDDRQLPRRLAARRRLQLVGAAQRDAGAGAARAAAARDGAALRADAAPTAQAARRQRRRRQRAASPAGAPTGAAAFAGPDRRAAGRGESGRRRSARPAFAGGRCRTGGAAGAGRAAPICRIDYPRGVPFLAFGPPIRPVTPPVSARLPIAWSDAARAAAFFAWLAASARATRSSPRRCGRRRATRAFAATSAPIASAAAASSSWTRRRRRRTCGRSCTSPA